MLPTHQGSIRSTTCSTHWYTLVLPHQQFALTDMSLAVCISGVIVGNPLDNNNNNNKIKNKTKTRTKTKNSNKNKKKNNKKYPLQQKATSSLTLAQDLSFTSTTVQIDLRSSIYESLISCML
ncbi:unnamed protein product [Polarella glacialis]|uniref:Uncharacterized protein n=1 Tax=Polarella glacialis TaxID=89957 RepID=A0A813LBK9_POLGL|nr:unnamed protein product [Polarella glacialis]CAE8723533.1 unnamed protein product [Polarella glacialis]